MHLRADLACLCWSLVRPTAMCYLGLSIGTSSGYRSIDHVRTDTSLHVFSRTRVYSYLCAFSVCSESPSSFVVLGKLGDFMVFRRVLMYPVTSPVVSVPF